MIARLLSWLPDWVTGRAGPRAKREVDGWTSNNPTRRTLRYGRFRRLLHWGTEHPLLFSLGVGAAAAIFAYIVAGQRWDFARHLQSPTLDDKFDLAAYTGVPWTVQATLVALVYPIVLSFIALMLQRRAHSTVALRVYVLDAAVIPAGASSIALLLFLGAQYFAAPYSNQCFLVRSMAPLLLMNGTWLACNLLLTGFFLNRTVRFIQDEEQRHAYTRVAVDVVLRAELISSVKQHIFVNTPRTAWGFNNDWSVSEDQPQVQMFRSPDDEPTAWRDLKDSQVLHDVHLHLLKWVVRSWCKRARKYRERGSRFSPVISFPQLVGEIATGEVVLCSVRNGPVLTALERALVRAAFLYRPSRQGTLSLSTREMLEEISVEVETAAEQGRFGAAQDGLENVIRLHKTLLLASAADNLGTAENAATIGTSPYSFGESSFDVEWLKPYRGIGRIAVDHLDADTRLFRTLAGVPANIAAALPPKPEKLVIDAMLVAVNLTAQLGGWWTRKADESLLPGATSFGGSLPAPMSKVYETTIVAFIGSWGALRIRIPHNRGRSAVDDWAAQTARALVYAKHIDASAQMFLKAVSRGDEVASSWLLESFIKWWGNRQYELECGDPDEFQVRHATLTLAEKSWAEVQHFLWDGNEPVTVDTASKALSLAIRRYWENMRLYLVLVLVQKAGATPAADCRELRLAARLIRGAAQQGGGEVECWPLDKVDTISAAILGSVFGVETVVGRIDAFAESLRWESEAPVVSGWIYGWSGNLTDLSSMKRAQAILLVAVATPASHSARASRKLIESWWRDIDKLEAVANYCHELRQEVLSSDFSSTAPAISALQAHLNATVDANFAGIAVSDTLEALRSVALYERNLTLRSRDVDAREMLRMAQIIGTIVFDPQRLGPVPSAVNFIPGLIAEQQKVSIEYDKKHFIADAPKDTDSGLAELIADSVRECALRWSFSNCVTHSAIAPANTESLRRNYDPTVDELQSFVSAVATQCNTLRSTGVEPAILLGQSIPSSYLRPHKWGANHWQCQLPVGITVRNGDTSKGESAVAFLNDTPVYEFHTPNGDCYVVPASTVKTLAVGSGDASSSVTIKWSLINDEQIKLLLSWKAKFV